MARALDVKVKSGTFIGDSKTAGHVDCRGSGGEADEGVAPEGAHKPCDNTCGQYTGCQTSSFRFNPRFCPQVTMRESCCSMHGFSGPVARANAVHVKGRNEVGRNPSILKQAYQPLTGGGRSKLEEQWVGGKDLTA